MKKPPWLVAGEACFIHDARQPARAHVIQARLATIEPTAEEMRVGVAALAEICRVEGITA